MHYFHSAMNKEEEGVNLRLPASRSDVPSRELSLVTRLLGCMLHLKHLHGNILQRH